MEYDYRRKILKDVLEEVQKYINENKIEEYKCIEFYDVFDKELFHIKDGKYYSLSFLVSITYIYQKLKPLL